MGAPMSANGRDGRSRGGASYVAPGDLYRTAIGRTRVLRGNVLRRAPRAQARLLYRLKVTTASEAFLIRTRRENLIEVSRFDRRRYAQRYVTYDNCHEFRRIMNFKHVTVLHLIRGLEGLPVFGDASVFECFVCLGAPL